MAPRDSVDPSLVLQGSRSRTASSHLTDKNNSEAPNAAHHSLIQAARDKAGRVLNTLTDKINDLCASLPTTIP
ncbi:hypothetical protein B0H13DRAFT_2360673 [Mycena leptocephala]|nr:hypothetical protein B0H13DRAFT_2360673 [Mycena leptocephala]